MRKNCEEIRKENKRRRTEEHMYGFPSMFLWMDSLSLKRIDISGNDINDHSSNEVSLDKYYLFGHGGRWHVSKPRIPYYARHRKGSTWEFNLGSHSTGLGSIDIIFEIEELDGYDDEPLCRLDYPDEDDYCEHCCGQCEVHRSW